MSGFHRKWLDLDPVSKSADFNIERGRVHLVDTTGGQVVAQLPAAASNYYFEIKDVGGDAATRNILVRPQGVEEIEGANEDYVISSNYGSIVGFSDGVKWWVFSGSGNSSVSAIDTQSLSNFSLHNALLNHTSMVKFPASSSVSVGTQIISQDNSQANETRFVADRPSLVTVHWSAVSDVLDAVLIIRKNGGDVAVGGNTYRANAYGACSATFHMEAGDYFEVGSNQTLNNAIANTVDLTVSAIAQVNTIAVVTDDEYTTGKSFSPLWGASGSAPSIGNGTLTGKYWREGKWMRGFIFLKIGSTTNLGTGFWYVGVPDSLDIDTVAAPATHPHGCGMVTTEMTNGGLGKFQGVVTYPSTLTDNTLLLMGMGDNGGNPHYYDSGVYGKTWVTNDSNLIEFRIPIAQWSAVNTMLIPEELLVRKAYIYERQPNGTQGGTVPSAGTWVTRTLNTYDGDSFASLNANAIKVPAGKYHYEFRAPAANGVLMNKARLYNITASAVLQNTNGRDCTGNQNRVVGGQHSESEGQGTFEVTDTTEIKLEHYFESTAGGDASGLGFAAGGNGPGDEIYSEVIITKVR